MKLAILCKVNGLQASKLTEVTAISINELISRRTVPDWLVENG